MNTLRKLAIVFLLAMSITTARAVTTNDLFAFAEANYSSVFSGTGTSGTYQGYTYRYYSASRNYLATTSSGELFILGPFTNNVLTPIGNLSAYASTITAWLATTATAGGSTSSPVSVVCDIPSYYSCQDYYIDSPPWNGDPASCGTYSPRYTGTSCATLNRGKSVIAACTTAGMFKTFFYSGYPADAISTACQYQPNGVLSSN